MDDARRTPAERRPSPVGGLLDHAGGCLPVGGAVAAGDWWDVVDVPDGTAALIVGDVAGHGDAVAPAAHVIGRTVRAVTAEGHDDPTVLASAGRLADRLGVTATLLYARLETATGRLRYHAAGHPPPLLLVGGQAVTLPVTPSPPLGSGWRGHNYWGNVALRPGATLILYSDGITDATGAVPPEIVDALCRQERAGADPRRLCHTALDAAGDGDDRTVLVVRRSPAGTTPRRYRAVT